MSQFQAFRYLEVAFQELDQAEIPGPAANPRIVEYHSVTSLRATSDEVAWCASFVNWCLKQSGLKGTGSARALSFQPWGTGCKPCLGAVVVINYGGGKGHVGFVVGKHGTRFVVLGGNQSNRVGFKLIAPGPKVSFRIPCEPLVSVSFSADGGLEDVGSSR